MAKTVKELMDLLRGYDEASTLTVPKDGHDLIVTRPDESASAIPIGLE